MQQKLAQNISAHVRAEVKHYLVLLGKLTASVKIPILGMNSLERFLND